MYSERCVEAYRKLALAQGAELLTYSIVRKVKVHSGEGGGVTVYTADDKFHAGAVLLTAGAWFSTLAPFVDLPIRAVRKVVGWFETTGSGFDAGRFPGLRWVRRKAATTGSRASAEPASRSAATTEESPGHRGRRWRLSGAIPRMRAICAACCRPICRGQPAV
ncbi:hypothetical protein HMSSN139_00750 [Paenibacillus sp. HMSSN-139]|nr:hypothetical protein HMSSN139_00750 [Paenibacillus sp. HMSSN-139]